MRWLVNDNDTEFPHSRERRRDVCARTTNLGPGLRRDDRKRGLLRWYAGGKSNPYVDHRIGDRYKRKGLKRSSSTPTSSITVGYAARIRRSLKRSGKGPRVARAHSVALRVA